VVSKNAVKHGLFTDSLVFGENEADYAAFNDEMLAELAPSGRWKPLWLRGLSAYGGG
jgi:hypothetical protein